MFYKHLITSDDNKKTIYLYLNQDYEISEDLYQKRPKNKKLLNRARSYMKDVGIDYKNADIYIVVGNVIVGKLRMRDFFRNENYKSYKRIVVKDHEEVLSDAGEDAKLISISRSSGIIEKYKFYEYLFGVIAREMPFIESDECLRAQAVIARTYLVKNKIEKTKIKEINQYQLFFDHSYLKKLWNKNYENYRNKILKAIEETDGEIITFSNYPIECYTHYYNTGMTEDSINVLKLAYPYLRSVPSYDYRITDFVTYRKVSNQYLEKLLGVKIDRNTIVRVLNSTVGNNVKYIQFNDKVFDGFILASKLGLISNNFTVQVNDNYTTFLTKGCGRGLGLSKCGAKVLSDSGYNYKQILSHYYPNTVIRKIKEDIF